MNDPCCRPEPPNKLTQAIALIVAAGIFVALTIRIAILITDAYR